MQVPEEIKNIVSAEIDQLASPLNLGVIYTIGPYLLPHLIPEIKSLAPNMTLIISEDYTDVLAEKLRDGEIDAAILSLPFDYPGVVTQNLYDEPFVGLDPISMGVIVRLVRKMNDALGISSILVSHDVQEISTVADSCSRRVLWLARAS